ncbi:hypothetical protein BR93DRAFT_964422 [Coniochaeta sp. PMI_546]|nr:hypothetical protein BR93DRAFT_964422 [Coniochaeta sp. PMI_546]
MSVTRIDGFSGDAHAYAGYLLGLVNKDVLRQCTQWLEEEVTKIRQTESVPSSRIQYPTSPPDHDTTTFESFDPSVDRKQSLPSTSMSRDSDNEVAAFIKDMPTSEEEWGVKRKSVGMSSAADILRALRRFSIQPLSDNSLVIPDHTTYPDLQETLKSMARNVGSHMVKSRFERNLSHFMSLVFTAACCVALYAGHPEPLVAAAQREFLAASQGKGKCTAANTHLRKCRSTVKWVVQEQQRQFERGLEHRAFELFFNEGKSLHFYNRLPKKGEPMKLFTDNIPRCKVPAEIQASLPLYLPFCVAIFAGDRWRVSTICKALGVTLLSRDEEYQSWKGVLLSGKLVACRIQNSTSASSPATSEDVAVATDGKGSAIPGSQTLPKGTDPAPRDAGPLCPPSPVSLIDASPPTLSGSTTRCSSEEIRTTQFRPINNSKHYRSESTTSVHDPRAKRRKTQPTAEGQGHDRVSNLPDQRPAAQGPLEGLTQGWLAGREAACPTAVFSRHLEDGLLPSVQPMLAGSELSDEPPGYNLNQTHSTCGLGHLRERDFNISAGGSTSPFHLLLAAAEQNCDTTSDTSCFGDGQRGSREGFGPMGDPGLMLGAPAQPGAGPATGQNPRMDQGEPSWEERPDNMNNITYDTDTENDTDKENIWDDVFLE